MLEDKTLDQQTRPVAIDLFSGCGGMSLGLEAAGFDIALAVELDPIHALVHHFNFPYTTTLCKSIVEISSEDILKKLKEKGYSSDIDLIAGGPPCQGFSQIGKRQLNDPRNSLVFEYLRIIREIRPKYFLFENVPGMGNGKHKVFLDELLNEFNKLGYKVPKPVKILSAASYGAPQKRNRLIILGYREDVNPVRYPVETHFPVSGTLFKSLKFMNCEQAISDLANHKAYIGQDNGISYKELDYTGMRSSFSLQPQGKFSLCHKRTVSDLVFGHRGSKHTLKSINRFNATPPGSTEKISRFFKLSKEGQCNTLRAGTASDKGAHTAARPIHYSSPRCITVREAARLHTFPDWFHFHNTIWHGFREIGNSVIPFFAKCLGDEFVRSLDLDPNTFCIKTLKQQDISLLNYPMNEASDFWKVSRNVIPKRKRLKRM